MEIKAKDSVNFTLRMPASQRFQLEQIAAKESRTVTNLINMVLKQYIEEYQKTKNRGYEINRNPLNYFCNDVTISFSADISSFKVFTSA